MIKLSEHLYLRVIITSLTSFIIVPALFLPYPILFFDLAVFLWKETGVISGLFAWLLMVVIPLMIVIGAYIGGILQIIRDMKQIKHDEQTIKQKGFNQD